MLLVHDVLDKQLLDRNGHRMGKVDGLVLELREGAPPRVVYLETGATTLGMRLGRPVGRLVQALARRWSPDRTEAWRVPWAKVRGIDLRVHVDEDCESTRVYVLERWLRTHIVAHIPGGRMPPEPKQ